MCTSGEESSVELGGAQADTDEQQSSEEWLVRSKAPRPHKTSIEYQSWSVQVL